MAQPAVPIGRVALQVAHKTDPGLDPDKQINEDACTYAEVPCGHLLVLCDGMGGHASGRDASERAIQTIFREMQAPSPSPGGALKHSIEVAGRAVYELGGPPHNRLRPGSTCVSVLVHAGGIEVAHVGDSRGYMVRAGQIYPITRDHSMVQQMIDAGVLSPQDAVGHPDANKITRALGMSPEIEVELRPTPISHVPGDLLLLASDGLTDLVAPHEILSVLQQALQLRGLSFACDQLVALSNARGGHDNITVMIGQVGESSPDTIARPTIPETVAAAAMPQPVMTVPEMPALADATPGTLAATAPGIATTGPAPTMIDEQYASDPPDAGAVPTTSLQPVARAPEWPASDPPASPRSGRSVIAGLVLLVAGLVIIVGSFFWAVSHGAHPESADLEEPTVDSTPSARGSAEPFVDPTARPRADAAASSSAAGSPSQVPRPVRSSGR
jgi:protein phosphatase